MNSKEFKKAEKYAPNCLVFMKSSIVQREIQYSEFKIRKGNKHEDCELVADYLSKKGVKKECKISLRVSFPNNGLTFENITIRAYSNEYGGYDQKTGKFSGARIELQKIIEGEGDFMLTCFVNKNKKVMKYLLICLNMLRNSGLLEHEVIYDTTSGSEYRINGKDKKGFIAIDIDALRKCNCIVAEASTVFDLKKYWKPFISCGNWDGVPIKEANAK